MGMYDSINGEQVKCFPWVSFYRGEIVYHGGTCSGFKKGSEVPYRKPHYNYGKNFLILDYNWYPKSDLADYVFYLHIIENGKVVKTTKDKLPKNLDWSKYPVIVSYSGELLNIHSNQEASDYMAAQLDYYKKRDQILTHHNKLFKELSSYAFGIALLSKTSEERRFREQKIDELHQLIEQEDKRIEPELKALDEINAPWFVDTSAINDLITLGDFISASMIDSEDSLKSLEIAKNLLNADESLYSRYVEWQGSDDYVRDLFNDNKAFSLK